MKIIKHIIEGYRKDKSERENVQYTVKNAISLIDTFDKQTMLEVRSKLNNWKWDNRLGNMPANWETLAWYNHDDDYENLLKRRITKSSYIDPIIEHIEKYVTLKEILKYHHLFNLHKTETEFEEWWHLYHC